MMRITVGLAFLSFSVATGTASLIAFERGSDVYVANVDGTNAKKLGKGSMPDVSPDGKRVALHTDDSTKSDVVRHIAVANVATKKLTVFKSEIPSENCQRAIWSPDGRQLLFELFNDADWHLALINADGSGFRYLKKASPKGNSYWSACWAADGKSIYAQNLNDLCQFDLEGNQMQKWKIDSLFIKGGFSSGSSLAISPDGRMLLADVEMEEEEAKMPDWDGPPPSIWMLDLATRAATRLTPKGVIASKGCWLDNERILFTSQAAGEKQPTIYEMNVNEKKRKPLLRNGSNASASTSSGAAPSE